MRRGMVRKGITLVELITVLALATILIAMSANGVIMLFKTHDLASSEYDLHSAARRASDEISETIRYSQAVFALPFDYVKSIRAMDPDWEYIAVSQNAKQLVRYKYDSATRSHVPHVLIGDQDNVEYEIIYDKISAQKITKNGVDVIVNDNILHYSIVAYLLTTAADGTTTRSSQKVVFESEVKALNALQVVDKGTTLAPAVALAYRKDDSTYGEGRAHVVKIGLILDTSGSMQWVPGRNRYPYSGESSRLEFLKEALIGTGLDGSSGLVAQFAPYKNFEIAVSPFAQDASQITNSATSTSYFNAYLHKSQLVTQIKKLSAGGGTNTGDGIRQSYYYMKNFNTGSYGSNAEQHDFTIILVDGDSNMFTYDASQTQQYTYLIGYDRWGRPVYRTYYVYNYYSGDEDRSTVANNYVNGGTNESWNGFGFVTTMGTLIRNDSQYKGDYYLIGYVSDPNSAGVRNIKEALNIPDNQVYLYNDSNFDLSEVFANIATEIMAKTWLVTGPQMME